MTARTSRKLEMGAVVLIFSRLHPDPSGASAVLLARLENCLVRATHLARQQLDGRLESHRAALRKRELLRIMRRAHLSHLRHVVRIADPDLPELWRKFTMKRGTIPYRTFRAAAGAMVNEALSQKEVLVQYGLAEMVLQSLVQTLDEFDRVTEQGTRGHGTHVEASAALDTVAGKVVQIVKAMDGLNRVRFAHNSEGWAAWRSASHVVATPRSPRREEPRSA